MEPIKIRLGENQTIADDVVGALNHLHIDGERVTVVQEDLKNPQIITISGILARSTISVRCSKFCLESKLEKTMSLVRLQTPEPKPGKNTLQGIQGNIARATGHHVDSVCITDLRGVMYVEWLHSPQLLEMLLEFTDGVHVASEVQ